MEKINFIEKAHKIHNNKYDYSKVDYINSRTKVCIICPIHGEFWQTPNNHLNGNNCPICGKIKRASKNTSTTEEFIKRAKEVHGDKYDYSKVDYIGNKIKVCIICPIHGEFWQTPSHHLKGCGCNKCSYEKNALTTEKFIKIAKEIYGNIYDYSKTIYVNFKTKVCVICPIHGEFEILPLSHIGKNNRGCPICGKIKRASKNTSTTEEFIKSAREIHGDKYDYSKVEYKNVMEKVIIICPIHGEFEITPNSHLSNHGCPKCANNQKYTTEDFINLAREIHGNKYDYSKVEYKNVYTNICIICPIHGEFWQKPSHHLYRKCGCPICNESHLERDVRLFLQENDINFEQQKRFDWLGKQSLDFYLPEYNIAIECQGKQHFKSFKYFGGEKRFKEQRKLDINKSILCKKNGLNILYYSDYNYDFFDKVYYSIVELFNIIKNGRT